MARDLAAVEEEVEVEGQKFKIVELAVDPPNTIKRTLVPADTTEDDIPVGARLLDERETAGHLARASRPDPIRVGDAVRRKSAPGERDPEILEKNAIKGTVEGLLKSGKFVVKFENGVTDRFEAMELAKVW